jgi:hypothetical protein
MILMNGSYGYESLKICRITIEIVATFTRQDGTME